MSNLQHTQTGSAVANWQTVVAESVGGLKFGVVQIVVHDGKVVQIERTEKLRLDHKPTR